MREIKFRAWNIKGNKWHDSWSQLSPWGTIGNKPTEILLDIMPMYFKFVQYTGLKDKNGKEIYEGDIVLTDDVYHDLQDGIAISEIPDGKLVQVRFENGAFLVGRELLWEHAEYLEVVGNAYENPDLLK